MVTKDEGLKRMFQAVADRTAQSRGACQIRQGETMYSVCGACVLMAPCPDQYRKQPEGKPCKLAQTSLPVFTPRNPTAVYPENVFASWCLEIPAKDVAAFRAPNTHILTMCRDYGCLETPSIMAVQSRDNAEHQVLATIPIANGTGNQDEAAKLGISFFVMPDEFEILEKGTGFKLDAFKAAFMVSRRAPMPVICLTGDDALLYMTLQQITKPFSKAPIIVLGNDKVTLSAWDQTTLAYAEIFKEGELMPKYKLQSPVAARGLKATPVPPIEAEIEYEELTEAKEQEQVKLHKAVLEDAHEQQQEQQEQQQQPEPEQKTEPVVEQPEPESGDTQTKAKRTRTKRPANTTFDVDMSALIEYLSSPVDDLPVEMIDAAMDEIRQIRDLQIAAARRSANLMIAMHKICRPSVEALEEIRKALSGKVGV